MAFRNRVVENREVKASELVRNPKNFRVHPDEQRAEMEAVLRSIGFASGLITRKLPDGRLMIIEGEMRSDLGADDLVPVQVTDLSESEADELLAVWDMIGQGARRDNQRLTELLDGLRQSATAGVGDLLARLRAQTKPKPDQTQLKQLETRPPPKMSWALVGIPTVRFGEISAAIEQLAAIDGVVCETSATNEGQDR